MAEGEVAVKDVLGAVQKVAVTRDEDGVATPHYRDPETIAALGALLAAQPVDPASDAGQQAIADAVAALAAAQPGDPATNASLVSLLNATAVRDNLGNVIQPANYAHTITYNPDGSIATEFFVAGGNTYTKTFTWTSGNLISESGWVRS